MWHYVRYDTVAINSYQEAISRMQDTSVDLLDVNRNRAVVLNPPYVSFNTFRTLLIWLKSEGVPLRFDRSFWQAKFSGTTGTQLMAALRFLHLLDGETPLPCLETLVLSSHEQRRHLLGKLLLNSYSVVPFEELPRATPAMVKKWFASYPIDGHTLRKALSFFINAAREATLPMSNAVGKMARAKRPDQAKTSRTDKDMSVQSRLGQTSARQQSLTTDLYSQGYPETHRLQTVERTVALESGGFVALTLNVNLFSLSDQDRAFVLDLVDIMRNYSAQRKTTRESNPDNDTH